MSANEEVQRGDLPAAKDQPSGQASSSFSSLKAIGSHNSADLERDSRASFVESESEKEVKLTGDNVPEFARGKTIVGWDGPDDPKNPKNWPRWRKLLTTGLMSFCTLSMYMGAGIVTPAAAELQEYFNTTTTKTALGLTLFVWGYGLGTLWWSPMSEIPVFRGRNYIYLSCQFLFTILQIPTGLTNHLAPYAVLRFLAGIFASPTLATTGATLSDIWDMPSLIYALIVWAYGAVAGPFIGPLIGASLSVNYGFRYIFWYLLATAGGLFFLMLLLLPETSEQELLIRKARKLRKTTGSDKYIAPGEIIMHTQKAGEVLKMMFLKPIILTIMEPIVLLIDLHIGLVYSVMYLFFEALPIAYIGVYGFTLVEMGCAFLSFLIGAAMGSFIYGYYVHTRTAEEMGMEPERVFGRAAVFGSCCFPVGIMLWGWLSNRDIHWVVGMIGNLFTGMGAFTMFQSYFAYLGVLFPPNTVGSAFASNNLVRSLMGGAFPLFGHVFYAHTSTDRFKVGWGCTILSLIGFALIPLPVYMFVKGKSLREYAQRKYGDKILQD